MTLRTCSALLVFAATLMVGCAPDTGGIEEAATPPAAEANPVATPVAVTPQGQAAEAVEGQVAVLGVVVQIPFEHKQVYDRVRPGANQVPERQVGLIATGTDHKALAIELQQALDKAGLRTRASENRDGWVWITLDGDAGPGKVAVRPDGKKPETVIVFKLPET